MRIFAVLCLVCLSGLWARAQATRPVRLAVIAESPEIANVADMLTAQLSASDKVQMLERSEIERVYREQALAAGARNDVRLGKLLGADGLLLVSMVRFPTSSNLVTRLIAVKPGVVLETASRLLPLRDESEWSAAFASHEEIYLPKLEVPEKNAIAISVVNMRSTLQSAEAAETEREVKLLAIQRLSEEPQMFVLERQRMELLTEEKGLNSDESGFWSGSYLLEGVLDQNGYSKESITLDARLTPSKGGVPAAFQLRASRTNPADLVNQLAARVKESLKANSDVKEWSAADEAQKYFDEAKWALRWNVFAEAQMASESAWALGRHDMDCAVARIESYVGEISNCPPVFDSAVWGFSGAPDSTGAATPPNAKDPVILAEINSMRKDHPLGMSYYASARRWSLDYHFVFAIQEPIPANIDRATRALELYGDFSRNPPPGLTNLFTTAPPGGHKNSGWYETGLDALTAASRVLMEFNFVEQSQQGVADKLAELRALARSDADLILQSPAIRTSYYVGDRLAPRDQLAGLMQERPNIFSCELIWGPLWQERPEDALGLYRKLMVSPVFSYIHGALWGRQTAAPESIIDRHAIEPARMVGWNEAERRRIPELWHGFVRELETSSNLLARLEGQALETADASDEAKKRAAFTNLCESILNNGDELAASNVELFYLEWGVGGLASGSDEFQHEFFTGFRPKLMELDNRYWKTTVRSIQFAAEYQRQKDFLLQFKPFDIGTFARVFQNRDYSKAQAVEIQPLIAAYKTNLIAQTPVTTQLEKMLISAKIFQLDFLTKSVERALNAPVPAKMPTLASPQPMPRKMAKEPSARAGAPAKDIVTVNKFIPLPLERDLGANYAGVALTAHHWVEGRMVLDLTYTYPAYTVDTNGKWTETRLVTKPAVAILNERRDGWDVVTCPEVELAQRNRYYNRTTLWRGALYNSDGNQIRKYDFTSRKWDNLPVSDGNNSELLVVNDHLYGANPSTIFEITPDGQNTRLLASNRRQTPVSTLDTMDLGTPILFGGPEQSLRAVVQRKVYTWTGLDWRPDLDVAMGPLPPMLVVDGLLIASGPRWNDVTSYSHLGISGREIEVYQKEKKRAIEAARPPGRFTMPGPISLPGSQMRAPLFGVTPPVAARQSEIIILENHSRLLPITNAENVIIGNEVVAIDGYHAKLRAYFPDQPQAAELGLKFDAPLGRPPAGKSAGWIFLTDEDLFFGQEDPFNLVAEPAGRGPRQYLPGVWILPTQRITPIIDEQKRVHSEQAAKEASALATRRERLLSKYDLNRNGVIDREEREDALDDAEFIAAELELIDTNHNDWLDPAELDYFDANTNKTLEAKEQAGIGIALHLLAGRLMEAYDNDRDGRLDRAEFERLAWDRYSRGAERRTGGFLARADADQDGFVDSDELEHFLKGQLIEEIRGRSMPAANLQFVPPVPPARREDETTAIKRSVESYWRDPGGKNSRRVRLGPRTPGIRGPFSPASKEPAAIGNP